MRENKFRAWDRETKTMTICRSLVEWLDAFAQFEHDTKNNQLSRVKQFEFMQYTGLKDKNGKEIYEGDIIEINNKLYTIQNEIGSMMFVRISDDTNMNEEFDNCWNDDVYPISQYYWENDCEENILSNCEVIGNICENEELLEE